MPGFTCYSASQLHLDEMLDIFLEDAPKLLIDLKDAVGSNNFEGKGGKGHFQGTSRTELRSLFLTIGNSSSRKFCGQVRHSPTEIV
jgi:hypothetical protein